MKTNVSFDYFFISQSPGFLDPVFQFFQIKFEAKNNPLYTVYRSFIFSPFLNCVLTPIQGPPEPIKTRSIRCSVRHSLWHRPSIPARSPCLLSSLPSPFYSTFRMLVSWLDFFFILFYLFNDLKCFIFHFRQWIKAAFLWYRSFSDSGMYLCWVYKRSKTEVQLFHTLSPRPSKSKSEGNGIVLWILATKTLYIICILL